MTASRHCRAEFVQQAAEFMQHPAIENTAEGTANPQQPGRGDVERPCRKSEKKAAVFF